MYEKGIWKTEEVVEKITEESMEDTVEEQVELLPVNEGFCQYCVYFNKYWNGKKKVGYCRVSQELISTMEAKCETCPEGFGTEEEMQEVAREDMPQYILNRILGLTEYWPVAV